MNATAIDTAKLNEYLGLVAAYLGLETLDGMDYSRRRMAVYYFSVGIPAIIAAKQIRETATVQ